MTTKADCSQALLTELFYSFLSLIFIGSCTTRSLCQAKQNSVDPLKIEILDKMKANISEKGSSNLFPEITITPLDRASFQL